MTIRGVVNSNYEPLIRIGIVLNGKTSPFDAIIDTGFNGFISIPHGIIEKTTWQFVGYESYELASGEIIKDKVYLGDVLLGGKKKYTYILSNKTNDILLGTKLFSDKVMVIDFKSKKIAIR